MTPEELAAIRTRAEAATPGPWYAWDRGVGWHIVLTDQRDKYGCPPGDDTDFLLPAGHRTDLGRAEDAAFIAHARTDVPALLAEVERLRADIEECQQHNDTTCVAAAAYGQLEEYVLTLELGFEDAEARGFRRAVEALRDGDAFEQWLSTQDTVVSDSFYRHYFADFLESLAGEEESR